MDFKDQFKRYLTNSTRWGQCYTETERSSPPSVAEIDFTLDIPRHQLFHHGLLLITNVLMFVLSKKVDEICVRVVCI